MYWTTNEIIKAQEQVIILQRAEIQTLQRQLAEANRPKQTILKKIKIFLLTFHNIACIMLNMILDEIRKHLKTCGKSLNQITRETGVDTAALSRMVHGGSCRAETLEKLLQYFGYEIRKKKSETKSRAKK